MRYRYGIYAMVVLSLTTALLLFNDLDFGLTVINLIIWPIVIVGAVVVAIRTPRYRRNRGSRRRKMAISRASSFRTPSRPEFERAETPALIEYRNGSV